MTPDKESLRMIQVNDRDREVADAVLGKFTSPDPDALGKVIAAYREEIIRECAEVAYGHVIVGGQDCLLKEDINTHTVMIQSAILALLDSEQSEQEVPSDSAE